MLSRLSIGEFRYLCVALVLMVVAVDFVFLKIRIVMIWDGGFKSSGYEM